MCTKEKLKVHAEIERQNRAKLEAWKRGGCPPQETTRRNAVCARLNVLAHKRAHTTDGRQARQIDRRIAAILRQERPWANDMAFYLY